MAVISLEHVSYSYDDRKKILDDLSLSFERGKMYVILGPSGAERQHCCPF